MSFWNKKKAKYFFKNFNYIIHSLKNHVHELTFYDKLSIENISKAFKKYARTYKIEMIVNQALEICLNTY